VIGGAASSHWLLAVCGGVGWGLKFFTMDALMRVLAPVLEYLFFIGMAGSVLVIVISAIEDIYTILEKD
jgi:hypothetical protein